MSGGFWKENPTLQNCRTASGLHKAIVQLSNKMIGIQTPGGPGNQWKVRENEKERGKSEKSENFDSFP